MGDYSFVTALKGDTVKIVCERENEKYSSGCGYYLLQKKEDVQVDKKLLFSDGKDVISDPEIIRQRIGKPAGAIKVAPSDIPAGWSLYVQSTSANRKLDEKALEDGTNVLIDSQKGETIQELCKRESVPFYQGCGYYLLSKKEDISASKDMIMFDGKTFVEDLSEVRKRLGKGEGNIKIGPKDAPTGWGLYIQSTSASRKLDGEAVIVKVNYGKAKQINAPVGGSTGQTVRIRAKNADKLFNKGAGLLKQDGVAIDQHGNAAGLENDLGTEGAFAGLKIIILSLYRVNLNEPLAALKSKGFDVDIYTAAPSLIEFKNILNSANQLWVISDSTRHLSEDVVDFIVQRWKSGLACYIFGDNLPFYVDGNIILKAMGLPEMSGDYKGDQYLGPFNPNNNQGYITHEVTTGISQRLYEGITIAEFNMNDILKTNCTPILYNSRGSVSVILREAMYGCGQIIADGAFTKLYYKWDAAGSDRFVRNCACYLAADFTSDDKETSDKNINVEFSVSHNIGADIEPKVLGKKRKVDKPQIENLNVKKSTGMRTRSSNK